MFTQSFTLSLFLFTLMGGLVPLQPARAQNATAILAKVDSVQNAFADMTANERMLITEASGTRKEREVLIKQKGSELRMVQFLKPAEVQGVGFLRISSDRQYLYLPAFRKVRRIASSSKSENFMGTDFSYEDMSQSTYLDDYEARDLKVSGDRYKLELYPRSGTDVTYAKLILYVSGSNHVIQKIEYFDDSGQQVKELNISNIENINGYWMGKTMEMKTLKNNHRTELILSDIEFDQGLSDSDFSERMLKRPIR
ncbi:MAG: outer membrane lipoprotein-sorting protein [Gracilimonas sp.]|uniref:outer membrane lipoprotein-sorting protein n=1 Tax=Gracilimonas sp. TaxID=1974203 RepID=UPI003753A4A8|nr:outer membrane lipoprotein-sorting protein [Gracilimonas sp.]